MEKIELTKLIYNSRLFNKQSINELKKLTIEYPYFQLGWVLYLKALKETNAENYAAVLKEVAVRIHDRKRLYQFLNSEIPEKGNELFSEFQKPTDYQLKETEVESRGDSLIDKFLAVENVSLKPGTNNVNYVTDEYLNKVVANSVTESDELVTETLANILIQQENYSKAQDAYRKLSLKYPEKSVYFASRIKEIEKLKNNN